MYPLSHDSHFVTDRDDFKHLETPFSGFFTQLDKLRSLRRSFLHFNFISALHIWFISYIINTHFFHGNIWTHNWPAPNVRGLIQFLPQVPCLSLNVVVLLLPSIYRAGLMNRPANYQVICVSSCLGKLFCSIFESATPRTCHVFQYTSQISNCFFFYQITAHQTASLLSEPWY